MTDALLATLNNLVVKGKRSNSEYTYISPSARIASTNNLLGVPGKCDLRRVSSQRVTFNVCKSNREILVAIITKMLSPQLCSRVAGQLPNLFHQCRFTKQPLHVLRNSVKVRRLEPSLASETSMDRSASIFKMSKSWLPVVV